MANVFARRFAIRTVSLRGFKQFSCKTSTSRLVNRTNLIFSINNFKHTPCVFVQSFCNKSQEQSAATASKTAIEKKLSIFQRFKQMYKDYWYVLVPVHLVTSAAWFGSFYYMAKSGIDIVGILESWHMSEKITNSLKDSSMGYIAVAYALYKIATPLRYTVTLGGTTISIKYLQEWGYIKPVQQLKVMYEDKKSDLMITMRGKKEELELQKEKLKDKKDDIIKDLGERISQMKEIKKNPKY